MKLSVVIPTYNRREKLESCIASFARQRGTEAIAEIIVVDDGSSDGTGEYLEATARADLPFPLRVRLAPHAGPAAARNAGVEAASGELVLFTGDDCVSEPGLVEEHLRAHRGTTGAEHSTFSVLGHTTWLPQLRITPFMHFQENGGSQFAYWRIADPGNAGWSYYYTTNISSPRALLQRHPFDERFPAARFEDMELGYRLERTGHRIIYCDSAIVWHDHTIEFETFRRASFRYGRYAALFHRIHPDEALARSIGIHDAYEANTVSSSALGTAERTVQELECARPAWVDAPPHFGERAATAILAQCYKLLIHFELLRGIRDELGLPPPRWVADSQPTGRQPKPGTRLPGSSQWESAR